MKKNLLSFFCILATNLLLSQTFNNNGILYSVTSPTTVSVAGNSAFSGAANIPEIVSDGSTNYTVTGISNDAFNTSGLTSITLPNSLTTIGMNAFYQCLGLTTINIPNSVSSMATGVFSYCINLTTANLPNSLTTLSSGTFAYCQSLTSIVIPSSITTIGQNVFFRCYALNSVTVSWPIPPAILLNVFTDVNVTAATLHVPPGTESVYNNTLVWKNFGNITSLNNNSFLVAHNIKLFPNPMTNFIELDVKNMLNSTLEVFDINGKTVIVNSLNSNINRINVESLESGLYMFKISSNEGVFISKVIKK